MRSKRWEARKLPVALVTEILASLNAVKGHSDLGGRRRRELEYAVERLKQALSHARNGTAPVTVDTMIIVLSFYSASQQWFSEMLANYSGNGAQK